MIEKAFLAKLDEAQADLARSALLQPSGKDLFDYGRLVGIYAGLEQARSILIDILTDRDEKDRRL